ncbi:hypothetical protein EJB05_28357 [Eragrostis curvula]|uniref:Auxin-responsive protein n=1 Tax=Eragrostis curvula TaxID=38414 RepID=A0A5J9UQK4_9POAL|nr:hypothetical protein EJB05_28357 [Eragrostis curvula]
MMNLLSFETPPLGRQERVHATTATTTAIRLKEASSSGNCFHGHLDLSLSMSLSPGGSGCDTIECRGAKASDGHRGANLSSSKISCLSSGITTATTASKLSTGHGQASDLTASVGWTSAFMPSPAGFMHPWSLAARQQKAAAEQDRTATAAYVPSEAHAIPLPSAVGWPPVHTSRRNLITAMHTTKSDGTVAIEGQKEITVPAGNEKNAVASKNNIDLVDTRAPANMFAKVHMEGYTIARKINLRAHGTYESLSRVLRKMTINFFCHCSSINTGEEKSFNSDKFIFLYEDFEGDRMLVGDVPWELFQASAKRLYIVREKGHPNGDKNDGTEKEINN